MFLIELESSKLWIFPWAQLCRMAFDGVCILYHPVSSWIMLSSRPVQVHPNLSAMPRPCKRKLRPLSDDDSDGPDTCDAAQAASPAARHAPGIGTTRSTSGSPSSSESSQVPKNRGKTWKLRKKLSRLHLGSLKRWMRWVRASWWLIRKPLGSLPGIVQDVPWPKLRLSHSASPFSPYPRKRS